MDTIQLNFVNNSGDRNNSQIVFFQKNNSEGYSHSVVAWKVIKDCEPGHKLSFEFPLENTLQVKDERGNLTQVIKMPYGKAIEIVDDELVDIRLQVVTDSGITNKEVFIKNVLQEGTADVNIYKDNKLLATYKNLPQYNTAKFLIAPASLCIAAVYEMPESAEIVPVALDAMIITEFSLAYVISADIVMTGGGTSSKGFEFNLENVVKK